MNPNLSMDHCLPSDLELVARARESDRAAFGVLVSRHQAAACSVAYAVCGDFQMSEDLAQEAFVAAWTKLGELRDATRFRAWICGTARNLALAHLRRTDRAGGRPQESDATQIDDARTPAAEAVSSEESSLVWQTLDALDETYREPLVLFYREQQSVADVASALELSEEVIRQRLSRGRLLLRDELARRIEGVFVRTRPGKVFTAGVLGALPPIAVGVGISIAGAGTASAATATGGSGTTAATTGAGLALGPILASALMGLAGLFVIFRTVSSPHVPAEIKRLTRRCVLFASATSLVFMGWLIWFTMTGGRPIEELGLSPAVVLTVSIILFIVVNLLVPLCAALKADRLRKFDHASLCKTSKRYESRASLLGLPLVSIAFGPDAARGETRGVAKGWFAMGDVAIGGLAIGGASAGVVAIGGVGVGLISLGGIVIGGLAFGGTTIGVFSVGALALGWGLAIGGCALAHHLAIGALAVASKAAFGGVALAALANDGAEWARLSAHTWVGTTIRLLPHAGWLSLLGLPGLFYAFHEIKQKRL